MRRIKVGVFSPNGFVREGIRSVLEDTVYEVVASADDVRRVSPPTSVCQFDLLVLSVTTADDIVASVTWIRSNVTAFPLPRVVALVDADRAATASHVDTEGVDAVLPCSTPIELFSQMLDLLLLGHRIFSYAVLQDLEGRIKPPMRQFASPDFMSPCISESASFSQREFEILGFLVRGESNKSIARQLKITEPTVKAHVKALLRKIRVNNRTQAAIWAVNHAQSAGARPHPPLQANRSPLVDNT